MSHDRLWAKRIGGAFALLVIGSVWQVPATAQQLSPVTSLQLDSEQGDYIGAGQFQYYTTADGTFSAGGNSDSFQLSFQNAQHYWTLQFAPPLGASFSLGQYVGAERYSFRGPTAPGLDVFGDGRGCTAVSGRFTLLHISYGPAGEVTSFRATFEQFCDGFPAALRGEVIYNVQMPVVVSAPRQVTFVYGRSNTLTATAIAEGGAQLTMSATPIPAGAVFTSNANSGTLTWTPQPSELGTWWIELQASNPLQPTMSGKSYTQIVVTGPPPANDDISQAALVTTVPFSWAGDVSFATGAPDDPADLPSSRTVWFAYTPAANLRIEANTNGSDSGAAIGVYAGTRGALTRVALSSGSFLPARVRFDAQAGTTYYMMVSVYWPDFGSAMMTFNVLQAPPAFVITPTVFQFGSVNTRTGTATLQGTVTCSAPASVSIWGDLLQVHAGVPINGYFGTSVFCDKTATWTADVTTPPALFRGRSVLMFVGGKARVTADVTAYDPESGEYQDRRMLVEITLRGAR